MHEARALVGGEDLRGAVDRAVVGDDEEVDPLREVVAQVRLQDILLVAHLEGHHELHGNESDRGWSGRARGAAADCALIGRTSSAAAHHYGRRRRHPPSAHRAGGGPEAPLTLATRPGPDGAHRQRPIGPSPPRPAAGPPPMRILFVFHKPSFVRYFESLLDELGARGHRVHIAIKPVVRRETTRRRKPGPELLRRIDERSYALVDRLCERHEGITQGPAPVRRDAWSALTVALRRCID